MAERWLPMMDDEAACLFLWAEGPVMIVFECLIVLLTRHAC